jgi:hypothetical protein
MLILDKQHTHTQKRGEIDTPFLLYKINKQQKIEIWVMDWRISETDRPSPAGMMMWMGGGNFIRHGTA